MVKRKIAVLLVLVAFAVVAIGCPGPIISTKGKATMILSTYNAQTANTTLMSNRTDLTEAQKENVRQKKAIIKKLDPLVKTYGVLVKSGGAPSAATEQEIYDLIDKLVALGQ
jgi:hypothetical protein